MTERHKARDRAAWPLESREWTRGGLPRAQAETGELQSFLAVIWEYSHVALSLGAPLCTGPWPPFPPGCGLRSLQRDLPPASCSGLDQATSSLDTHSTAIYGLIGHWFQHTLGEHLLCAAKPWAGLETDQWGQASAPT